ncbi:MAG: hypothetical protein QM703_05465 [Gemmatales bacterium]
MFRLFLILACTIILSGCRTTNGDRLPATAADNPDPIFGANAKLRQPVAGEQPPAGVTAPPGGAPAIPASQRSGSTDRIGPLQMQPRNSTPVESSVTPGVTPGAANLTLGVRPPPPEPIRDQQVKPVANTTPASSPELVQDYRNRMNKFGVAGLRTKALDNGDWEAVGHFPVASQPNQMRRIEAHGATEADALLAILEQLEKAQ